MKVETSYNDCEELFCNCVLDFCCFHPLYTGPRDYCECKELLKSQGEIDTPIIQESIGELPF